MHLHDISKKLSAKTYFDASFMCFLDLLHFVSLLTVYVVETQVCGLLSRIRLWVTDRSWQTGRNDPVLHFEVVFVVC